MGESGRDLEGANPPHQGLELTPVFIGEGLLVGLVLGDFDVLLIGGLGVRVLSPQQQGAAQFGLRG
ncbi:hypothetical protein D3C86_2177010 [compost metagenome]